MADSLSAAFRDARGKEFFLAERELENTGALPVDGFAQGANPLLTALDHLSFSTNGPQPATDNRNNNTQPEQKSGLNERAIKDAANITEASTKLQKDKPTVAGTKTPGQVKTDSATKLATIQDAKKSITENMKASGPQPEKSADKTAPASGVSAGKIVTSTLTGIGAGVVANAVLPGSGPIVASATTAYDVFKGLGSLSSMFSNQDSAPIAGAKNGRHQKIENGYRPSTGPTHSLDGRIPTGQNAQAVTNQFNKSMENGPGFGNPGKMLSSADVDLTSASLNGVERLTGLKPDAFLAQLDRMEKDYKLSLDMYEARAGQGLALTGDNVAKAAERGMNAEKIQTAFRTQTLDARLI